MYWIAEQGHPVSREAVVVGMEKTMKSGSKQPEEEDKPSGSRDKSKQTEEEYSKIVNKCIAKLSSSWQLKFSIYPATQPPGIVVK